MAPSLQTLYITLSTLYKLFFAGLEAVTICLYSRDVFSPQLSKVITVEYGGEKETQGIFKIVLPFLCVPSIKLVLLSTSWSNKKSRILY